MNHLLWIALVVFAITSPVCGELAMRGRTRWARAVEWIGVVTFGLLVMMWFAMHLNWSVR